MVVPQFTALSSEHKLQSGLDELDSYDYFSVSFDLALYDADPSVPITARLQAGSPEGGDWQDIPGGGNSIPTLSYSGSGETWSGDLAYDMYLVEIDKDHGRLGALMQMRVACDYTLTDGTTGTVYSTDIGVLYAYAGGYLADKPDAEGFSGKVKGAGLDVSFYVQKDLLPNPDILEKTTVVLHAGEKSIDLDPAALTFSSIAEDGTIRITCPLSSIVPSGESLHPGSQDEVLLELRYKDDEKGIDWSSSAWAKIRVRNIPTIEMDPYVYGPYAEGAWYPTHYYEVTLNDLKGGSAVGKILVDTGSGFYEPTAPEDAYLYYETPINYDPTLVPDDVWGGYAQIYLPVPSDVIGVRGVAKIVFDIVYPDGETDTIESETRPVYMGYFAAFNKSYGENGWVERERIDPESGETLYTMSFDLVIDANLIIPDSVWNHGATLWNDVLWAHWGDPEVEVLSDGGTWHMFFTFVSASRFPDGPYTLYPDVAGMVDEINSWDCYDLSLEFVKSTPTDLTPPAFLELNSVHDWDSASDEPAYDRFQYYFALQINDADPTKHVFAQLQYADIGSDNWTDCPYDGENDPWEYYSGTEAVWKCEKLVSDMTTFSLDGSMGMKKQVRIVVEYYLTDGSYGTVYSTDLSNLFIYSGKYVRGVSAELEGGKITATFQTDGKLVPDLSKVSVTSCTLRSGDKSWELLGKANISADTNGLYTVTYTLTDEILDTTKQNTITLSLNYSDYGGLISWDSRGVALFKLRGAPTLSVELTGTEGEPGFSVVGVLTLNDLEGGTAVFHLLRLGKDGFEPVAGEHGVVSCGPGDIHEGRYSAWLFDQDLYDLSYSKTEGRRDTAKIVVDYTYADGTTGTLESENFEQCAGRYSAVSNDPPFYYDGENSCLVLEVSLNLALVEYDAVSVINTDARLDTTTHLALPTLAEAHPGDDGTYRMIFTVPLDSLVPGTYSIEVMLNFDNPKCSPWCNEIFVENYLG